MIDRGDTRQAQRVHTKRRPVRAGAELLPLLRGSHLFASTVHELLRLEPPARSTPYRLAPSQADLLRVICLNGEHPVGQVARLLGISAPAATKTVDKLERLGLVVRQRCGTDRRTRLFAVSPAGRALVRRSQRRIAARLRAALTGFAPHEVDAFVQLLTRFSFSLLASEPAGGKPCLRCAAYVDENCPVRRARGGCPYDEFFRKQVAAAGERGGRAAAGSTR